MPYVRTGDGLEQRTSASPEKTEKVYGAWQATCGFGSCEWTGIRRSHESEAWGDLQGHLRSDHYGLVRQYKIKVTTLFEEINE